MLALRVLLGFANASDHVLEETALAVLDPTKGLYANATIYPSPPVTEAVLRGKLTAFTDAIGKQAQGGTQATAEKDQAAADLIDSLRRLAGYVQTTIQDNPAYGLAELLLSGFEAVSSNRTQSPLDTPAINGIENTGAGRLTFRVGAVRNSRMYVVEKKADGDADFSPAGMFTSTRGMEVTGLTPGVNYTFRVKALGGSTGESNWSDPVSHRSM